MPAHAGRSMPVNAGRGLNPRPERSTPARAEEQSPEKKSIPCLYSCCRSASYAGRGLNPRPERSTPAGAEEQSPENKNQSLAFARAAAPRPLCVPSRYAAELQWGDSRRRSGDAGKLPFSGLYSSAFAWVDHSGRGFNPRPAQERQRFFSAALLWHNTEMKHLAKRTPAGKPSPSAADPPSAAQTPETGDEIRELARAMNRLADAITDLTDLAREAKRENPDWAVFPSTLIDLSKRLTTLATRLR